jgi:hypothetical protein
MMKNLLEEEGFELRSTGWEFRVPTATLLGSEFSL